MLLLLAACGDGAAGVTTTAPVDPAPCTARTAADAVAGFLELATTDPSAADDLIATAGFGFLAINDDVALRLGDPALDRGSVAEYLSTDFTRIEAIEVVTMIVVGDPEYPGGYQANLSLVRSATGVPDAKWDGYAVFDCARGQLTTLTLRNEGQPSDRANIPPAAEMCPVLGGKVLTGVPYEACVLTSLDVLPAPAGS